MGDDRYPPGHKIIEPDDETSDTSRKREIERTKARADMKLETGDPWQVVLAMGEAVGRMEREGRAIAKAIDAMEGEDVHRRAHCLGVANDLKSSVELLAEATEALREAAAINLATPIETGHPEPQPGKIERILTIVSEPTRAESIGKVARSVLLLAIAFVGCWLALGLSGEDLRSLFSRGDSLPASDSLPTLSAPPSDSP